MARILINGVEIAINGSAVLINGDDEPSTGTLPFHKETRQGVIPSWPKTRTPVPPRESPIGTAPNAWPRKDEPKL